MMMTQGQIADRRSGIDRRTPENGHSNDDRRSGIDRRRNGSFEARGGTDYAGGVRGSLREGGAVRNGMLPLGVFPPTLRDFLGGIGGILASLVSGFYEASMDPRLWPEVLGQMRDAMHADAAAVLTHDFEQGCGQIEHSVSIDAMFVTAYREFYSRQNIWLQNAGVFEKADTVATSQQLSDSAVILESDYYRYWLRPQNLFHHLMGVLDVQGSTVTLLSFARAREKGAFWEDDTELLLRLMPHLRRGLKAGRALRRVQDAERILLDTLDVMPMGIALLGCSGAVLSGNRTAREIIDNEENLYVGSGGLGLKLPAGRFRLREVLSGAGGEMRTDASAETHTFSVPRGPGRRPLTLLLMPVKDRTMRRADRDPAGVLFFGDPERPVDIDPRQLLRIYGLSRAESRVAVLLAKGLRLEQAAQTLGLTYETVRKHLKQIFAKTGTDRQAELVRTLNGGPAGLRL